MVYHLLPNKNELSMTNLCDRFCDSVWFMFVDFVRIKHGTGHHF